MADVPILIDAGRCVGCGKCVKGCGFGALKLVEAPGANKPGKLAQVDPVLADGKVGNPIVAAEYEDVVALPARQDVVARAAVQNVIA